MDRRLEQLIAWTKVQLKHDAIEVAPASVDASFRRYFRVTRAAQTWIAMDAPTDKEDSGPFVWVAEILRQNQLHVPEIFAKDLRQGFLLLSDLGSLNYLDALSEETADTLYGDALIALAKMQSIPASDNLPRYDRKLLESEMQLFSDWFLTTHLGLELSVGERSVLSNSHAILVDNALCQPTVFVHRDYHSRNLMIRPDSNPGILDFQDAVMGPVTYDLVSLLKDCYVAWPQEQVVQWAVSYFGQVQHTRALAQVCQDQFLDWFHFMGAQRHLKAIGIFARLYHRDGKSQYLEDIPRTLNYLRQVASCHPPLASLSKLLEQRVVPRVEAAQ